LVISRENKEKLGRILISLGLIKEDALAKALESQKKNGTEKKPIGEFLVEKGFVSSKDIAKALGIQFNLPIIELENINIEKDLLNLLPATLAKKFHVLPLFKVGNELTVAIGNPTELEILDIISAETKCFIHPVLVAKDGLEKAIGTYYKEDKSYKIKNENKDEFNNSAKNIINEIISKALELGATDIHIEPGEKIIKLMFRIKDALIADISVRKPEGLEKDS